MRRAMGAARRSVLGLAQRRAEILVMSARAAARSSRARSPMAARAPVWSVRARRAGASTREIGRAHV